MSRLLLAAGAMAIGAIYFSQNAERLVSQLQDGNATAETVPVMSSPGQAHVAEPVHYGPSGSEIIAASPSGHFTADFRINGRRVHGMVDTGATFVAMNESTARKVGISISRLDFKYRVNTANGQAEAAHTTLSRMEVGSVRARDVEAIVMRDSSLNDTILVGLSFMQRLESYRVEGGALYLKN